MSKGKETCKILKEIRRRIAEANGIELTTSECRYRGECLGTCPKCEAEVQYLEQQLHARSLAGKAVAIAGISAGAFVMLSSIGANAQISIPKKIIPADSIGIASHVNTFMLRGTVIGDYTDNNGKRIREPLFGVSIHIMNSNRGTTSDINGKFEIEVCKCDSVKFSFIGFNSKIISVTDSLSTSLNVVMDNDDAIIMGESPVMKNK